MAKRKKLPNNNPPRRVEIRGQDHLLAYITPEEAALLKARGGSGEPGPMGIPAFVDTWGGFDDGDFGQDDPMSDATGGAGPSGGGTGGGRSNDSDPFDAPEAWGGAGYFTADERAAGQAARDAIAAHNAAVKANNKPGEGGAIPNQYFTDAVVNQMMKDEEQRIAEMFAAPYFDALGAGGIRNKFGGVSRPVSVFAPELFSSRMVGQNIPDFLTGLSGVFKGKGLDLTAGGVPLYSNWFDDPTARGAFNTMAIDQLKGNLAKQSDFMKAIGGFVPGSTKDIIAALEAGGRPVMDKYGNVKGAFTKDGLFGGEVYTGMPVEGLPETGWVDPYEEMQSKPDEIKPVDETGKCPEGYIFDEDLQACRLDTGTADDTGLVSEFGPGAYARLGLLDRPPEGLLTVGGEPYDFEAANRAWRLQSATRPEYFKDPYNLEGYTLLA